MLRRWRVLLLCWMALVLPLQAMAAAAMVACLPGGVQPPVLSAHQVLAGQSVHAPPHGLHRPDVAAGADQGRTAHQPQPQAKPPHPSHHQAHHQAHAAVDDGAAGNAPGAHTGHGTLKCCSLVGTLAVPQAPPGLALAPARFATPKLPLARPDPGVVPAGIDRPPRARRA